MKQIYIAVSSVNGYSHVMKYLDDITSDPQRECIEQRVEIIKFFDDYGEDATRRAFGKSRSTVYLWKQKPKRPGGRLSALAQGNRAPIRKRRRIVDPFVQDFIIPTGLPIPGLTRRLSLLLWPLPASQPELDQFRSQPSAESFTTSRKST
jgi:hypothetical protein